MNVSGHAGIARRAFSRGWALGGAIIAWELFVRLQGMNEIILPSPSRVFASLVQDFDVYQAATIKTLWVSIVGLSIGSIVGLLAAVSSWLSSLAAGFVSTCAIVVRSVPFVVFVPVLASIMGYSETMVVTIIALLSFFPSFVMVSSGLTSLPMAATDAGRVYGASALRKLRYLALPAATSSFVASIRLSSSRAILTAMVAEYLTGVEGLGRLFVMARADLASDIAFGAAAIAAFASLLMFYLASAAEHFVDRRLA